MRSIGYEDKYVMVIPPEEVWLDKRLATYGLDNRKQFEEIIAECRFEFPEEGGIMYIAKGSLYPYAGIAYPPATDNVAIFKRMVLNTISSYKNPLQLLFIKRDIRRLRVLGDIALKRYYLKPHLYARAVREVFRLVLLITKSEWWAHNVAMILQFDTAYRYRIQCIAGFFRKVALVEDMWNEINRVIEVGISMESHLSVYKWKKAQWLLNILLLFPGFRCIMRVVANEIRLEELIMDRNDVAYGFRKK